MHIEGLEVYLNSFLNSTLDGGGQLHAPTALARKWNPLYSVNKRLDVESFAFQVAIQKHKDYGMQNCSFTCCFVWVWNLVSHTEGGTKAEGVRE
jgi:hypothetical protein